VADVDSHLIEPPDLWTQRMPSKWGDLAPRVRYDERSGEDRWFVGDRRLFGVGAYAQGGYHEWPPAHPRRFDEVHPGGYDAASRLEYLDGVGVYYQLLYGNILGFHSHVFVGLEPAFATECVRAYNDFLTEFCSTDATRLIPLTMLPYWDIDASVRELDRAADMGHRGIVFGAEFDKIGLAPLTSMHWDPIFRRAQERELPINFHIGFSTSKETQKAMSKMEDTTDFVISSALMLTGNARVIAEVVVGGLCDRYPALQFVSVENGAGWLPYFTESMDWQWTNAGAPEQFRDRLLPSEYVHRQMHFMYWFEQESVTAALPAFADNLMFETDFPHMTSLTPGPASAAPHPREAMERSLAAQPEEIIGKVLQHNATKLYHLDPPNRRQDTAIPA
jgi:predicted TIM-barrel fold metal-dependent hydrolase